MRRALLLALIAVPAAAQDATPPPVEVEVVGGQQGLVTIAVPPLATDAGAAETVGRDIAANIASALRATGRFTPIGPAGVPGYGFAQAGNPDPAAFRSAGAAQLVTGTVEARGDGRLTIGCYVHDLGSGRELGRQGFAVAPDQWRRAARKCADLAYARATGDEPFLDTRIVYVAETGPKNARVKRLALMDSDGSNHRYLTTPTAGSSGATVLTPRFSPDGTKIAYLSYQGRRPRVRIMDLSTGQDRLLVPGAAFTFAARFSPDSRRIVFSMGIGGNSDIYIVDADGGTPQRLTVAPGADTSPSFSPDGRKILFESDRSGSQQLYVMNADGSDPRRISFGGGGYASPVWSPKGDLVAFTRISGGQFRIGVMRPDGSNIRLLTNAWHDEGPSWAPNGRFVMFQRIAQGSGNATLMWVSTDGGEARRMPTPVGGSDPSWSPLNK